jgi:DNA-binding CsgD family transcriptional regulator
MYLPTFALFLLIIVAITHRIIPQDRVIQIIDQEFWTIAGSITAISFKFLFILLFSILLYSWKFLSEKEQHQNLSEILSAENIVLQNKLFKIELANESHLDTIETMKSELIHLKDLTKIELSERQNEVLGNLAFYGASKSYPEIASLMNISLDGFQTHIYQIKKLLSISGTAGKQQLIFYAKENNLIEFATKRDNA